MIKIISIENSEFLKVIKNIKIILMMKFDGELIGLSL